MTKTFWLSFCDPKKPKAQRFLGACLVDVTEAEADDAALEIARRFPRAQHGAEWIAAATRKAHQTGCNPGGEVLAIAVPTDHPMAAKYPRNQLLSKQALEAIAPIMTAGD